LLITIVSNFITEFIHPYEDYPTWARITGGWLLLVVIFILAIYLQKAAKNTENKEEK
jgi:hypothetical protein